jgi:catechol 2,3-dioxygenase-like lactoylglutathione lyase family enzyme
MARRASFGFAYLLALTALTPGVTTIPAARQGGTPALVAGLDHIVIAVNDLEAAARRYQAFGFALKPGRPHDNGIRNQHVKFPDGTELELLTAPEARDALTTLYRRHLAAGDGPAFLALYAPEGDALVTRLSGAGIAALRSNVLVSFSDESGLRHIFFGPRNHSPTDKPEHFAHANSARRLVGAWLASDDFGRETKLFDVSGGVRRAGEIRVPDRTSAPVVTIGDGDVYLLPASRQLVKGRKVIGATVSVTSIASVRTSLEQNGLSVPPQPADAPPTSLFLPPTVTHGIWLEFRETRKQ